MVDYNLTNPEAASIFLQDMEVFRTHWLTPHTRLLVFEVLLANYNLGGFISSSFLLLRLTSAPCSNRFRIYNNLMKRIPYLMYTLSKMNMFTLSHVRTPELCPTHH